MRIPSHADSFVVLLLQAADEGRGALLFGDSLARARSAVPPFATGIDFPSVYFEFPLAGEPFLDVTVLYGALEPHTRIDSPAATGCEAMLAWYASAQRAHPNINCGFELDTRRPTLPLAAVHFQPRTHTELVEPFCEKLGEAARATCYLDLAARMPQGWPLSFFGMFRGRPASPLRVCGYLDHKEKVTCADDPDRLAAAFDAIGFRAYDDKLLEQAAALLAIAPAGVDFQFDVYPDGRLSDVVAFDVQFGLDRPEAVRTAFDTGSSGRVMRQFETWGIADERWRKGIDAVFARAIPVELDDGTTRGFAFTLMPQWAKVRWVDGVLQPSKLYLHGSTKLLDRT